MKYSLMTIPENLIQKRLLKWICLVFFLSFLTRLALLLATGPLWRGDTAHYLQISENIVRYGAIIEKDQFTGELRPQTLRMPGYMLYIAPFYVVMGVGAQAHYALAISQVIIVSAISSIIVYLGWVYFSPNIGVLAGVFYALDPWVSSVTLGIHTEALFSLLYILSFWIGAITVQKRNWRWSLLWGISLALCTYVRPVTQYHFLIPVIILTLLPIQFSKKAPLIIVSVAGFYLLVSIWMLRNQLETGYWDMVTHRGTSMLWDTAYLTRKSTPEDYLADPELAQARDIISQAPHVLAEMTQEPDYEPTHEGRVAFNQLREQMGLSERDADAIMAEIAYENLRLNFYTYMKYGIKNPIAFLISSQEVISFGADLGLIKTSVMESLERGQYFYPILNIGIKVITALLFAPFLFWGLLVAWNDYRDSRLLHLTFILALSYHFAIVALIVPDDRYRIPLHSMMWLYISCGLFGLTERWRQHRRRQTIN